jgi:heme/copper-type cytochrome/quinol oxidase subunit 3
MSPQTAFVLTVAASLLNGLVSPALGPVFGLWPLWYPQAITPVPELVFYGASLIVSTATLLVSAVPAAIAERAGLKLERAMLVWLGAAALLLVLGLA